jgi:hypothetical protein
MAVRWLCTILAVFIALTFCLPGLKAQKGSKPLTKEDVLELLTGDVPPERVAAIVRERGVSFTLTRTAEGQIRQPGGNEELLKAIRELEPKPPASPAKAKPNVPERPVGPPVLMIDATPGDAQVYIDDEPVGTTSPEGRLKLSRLSPGEHRVRLAHPGFQDHEETVQLTSGETTRVATSLQAAIATPAQTPAQPSGTVTSATNAVSEAPGYLGVFPVEQQPAGSNGVVISGAAPGSPADRAGMKVYDTILRISGREVRTPQELQAAVASHRAGEVVEVSWFNGSSVVTRNIQLSTRPPSAPLEQNANPPSIPSGGTLGQPALEVFYAPVMHDHGSAGRDYCVGVMAIGNGMIQYKSTNGLHVFSFPLSEVKEARRNGVYLVKLGAFHIKLVKGTNFNFIALNRYGQF